MVEAIQAAERVTSGEIRVHLTSHLHGDALPWATRMFARLGMHQTAARNGVLLLLATADRRFAIYGDEGINALVGRDFWCDVAALLQQAFAQDRGADGIVTAVHRIGEKLATHFPARRENPNELPDALSWSA